VKQKAEGLYVASSGSIAVKPLAVPADSAKKSHKKQSISSEGREAIRKAQKARWAAANKSKG
jgi:hypothetical protein